MGFEQRDLLGMDLDTPDGTFDIPPGEEAMFLSHEGGEDDVFDDILNQVRGRR